MTQAASTQLQQVHRTCTTVLMAVRGMAFPHPQSVLALQVLHVTSRRLSLHRPLRRLARLMSNTTGHTETPQHHLTAVYRVPLARPLPVEQVSQATWYQHQVRLTCTRLNPSTMQPMVTTSGKSRPVVGTPTRITAHSATTTGR